MINVLFKEIIDQKSGPNILVYSDTQSSSIESRDTTEWLTANKNKSNTSSSFFSPKSQVILKNFLTKWEGQIFKKTW